MADKKTIYLDVVFDGDSDSVTIRGWKRAWLSRKYFIQDFLRMCEEVGDDPTITDGDESTDHVEIEIVPC